MPGGLFSWRPRLLLGRKTPEAAQAVQITIPPEPEPIKERDVSPPKSQRNVRFDEARNNQYSYGNNNQVQHHPSEPSPPSEPWINGYGGEARVIGTMQPTGNMQSVSNRQSPANGNSVTLEKRTNDWRYVDDIRVNIAPLASTDIDADTRMPVETHHSRYGPPASRATSVLQSLREQKENLEYDERRRQASTLPNSLSNRSEERNINYGSTMQRQERNPPTRTNTYTSEDVYSTRHLDDMNVVFLQANDEVKRTILPSKIHSMHQVKMAFVRTFPNLNRAFVEQPHVKIYIQEPTKGALFYELEDPGDIKNKSVLRLREKSRLMSPVGFLDQPDYHSETEHDDGRRFVSLARPASAMAAPHVDFIPKTYQNVQKMATAQYDPYVDSYNSDTSSHDSRSVTRSGSATPVIDRESRVRMETMERQLAGLSTLVHTALVSKGLSESTQKDMADLRREILLMHPDSVRESSEEPTSSLPESISSHTAHQLSVFRNKLRETNNDLKQLKKAAQVNAQTANTLIREAGEKIERIVDEKMKNNKNGRNVSANNLNRKIAENDEINEVTRNEHSSRLAELLHELTNFEANVENVRGSVLANQKKLRMSEVEDLTEKLTDIGRIAATLKTEFPPIQLLIEQRIKRDMERVVREEKFIRDQTSAVDQSLRRCKALANIMVTMKKLAMVQDPTIQRQRKGEHHSGSTGSPRLPPKPSQAISMPPPTLHNPVIAQPPPPPPPPPPPSSSFEVAAPYTPNFVGESPKPQVGLLDGVLEEVGQPGVPPRPPSRFSVQDVRQKFQKPPELPDQLKHLIEDVARRASPAPEKDNIRQELEERQERLAEKQRQLRSQFQQLQQLTPQP